MAERRDVVEEERRRLALSLLRAIELGERFGMVFGFLVRATEIEPRQPEIEDLLRLDESCHGVGRSPLLERDLSLDHLGIRSRLPFKFLTQPVDDGLCLRYSAGRDQDARRCDGDVDVAADNERLLR